MPKVPPDVPAPLQGVYSVTARRLLHKGNAPSFMRLTLTDGSTKTVALRFVSTESKDFFVLCLYPLLYSGLVKDVTLVLESWFQTSPIDDKDRIERIRSQGVWSLPDRREAMMFYYETPDQDPVLYFAEMKRQGKRVQLVPVDFPISDPGQVLPARFTYLFKQAQSWGEVVDKAQQSVDRAIQMLLSYESN
jgi:hypothetical protein